MKLILQIIGAIFLMILGMIVLGFLMRMMAIMATMAIGFLFFAIIFALVVALIAVIFKVKIGFNMGAKKKQGYKVYDRNKTAVPLFVAEPSVKDLVQIQQMSILTEKVLDGTVLEVDNESQVIVLNDTREKEAVRVRINNGQFKGREGWVCRSVLQSSDDKKLISGS